MAPVPAHWPDTTHLAHLGGVPELLTIVLPVLLFFLVRRIQLRREERKDREQGFPVPPAGDASPGRPSGDV